MFETLMTEAQVTVCAEICMVGFSEYHLRKIFRWIACARLPLVPHMMVCAGCHVMAWHPIQFNSVLFV